MSDTIIINTNPPASETLVINTSTKAPESINVNQLGYVLSVNGKIGVVILDKNDIGLGNVDNTSDLDKPISNETLSALFLKTDLGLFLSLNSFITSNSGNWDSVYFTVNELSGNWNSVYSYVNQTSANEFNQQAVTTFILANSSNITQVNSLVNSNSSNWNIAYNSSTIYQSNSSTYATINFSNNKFLPLSGGNISGTLNVQTKLLSAGTDLFDIFLAQTLNYVPSSYNLSISNGNTVNLSSINTTFVNNSAKYESVYSNVIGNSANWNISFDRSNVFSTVSGRYNDSSTIVESNSANWNNAYNTGTVYQANSGTYATYNFVNSNFLNLTGGTIEGNLNVNGNFYIAGSAANINVRDLVITDPLIYLAEGNPSDILDIGFIGSYNYNSEPHEHTGLVRSHINKKWTLFSGLSTEVLSALSINFNDPSLQIDTLRANLEGNVVGGTVQGNTLSSTGLVYAQGGNSDNWNIAFDRSTQYQNVSSTFATNTTVNSVSSQLVLNTDFNNYKTSVASSTATLLPTTIYQNASGNWQSAYTTVQNNSATTWNYQGTDLKDLSANWQGTFTNVQSNSANWNIAYNTSLSYQSVSGTFATNTLLQSNSALLTPLTLTNNLTSQLVLNTAFNNYQTSVAITTATLLPTTIYQQASGNWQSTYTTFSQNSGNYCTKSLALAFAIAL